MKFFFILFFGVKNIFFMFFILFINIYYFNFFKGCLNYCLIIVYKFIWGVDLISIFFLYVFDLFVGNGVFGDIFLVKVRDIRDVESEILVVVKFLFMKDEYLFFEFK